MQTAMSAKGYSTVILVLDMNRFIVPEHRERFESVRGSAAFADVLRHTWFKSVQDQKAFTLLMVHSLKTALKPVCPPRKSVL